jgi:hypothetical protein
MLIDTLKSEYMGLANEVYCCNIGDKVYHLIDKVSGTVTARPEWTKLTIKWNDNFGSTSETIQTSQGGIHSFNIVLKKNVLKLEGIKSKIKKIQSITNRIDISDLVYYIKQDILTTEQLKKKFDVTDDEWDYLMDSPEIRFAFS